MPSDDPDEILDDLFNPFDEPDLEDLTLDDLWEFDMLSFDDFEDVEFHASGAAYGKTGE